MTTLSEEEWKELWKRFEINLKKRHGGQQITPERRAIASTNGKKGVLARRGVYHGKSQIELQEMAKKMEII
jgi:hypothetical protein